MVTVSPEDLQFLLDEYKQARRNQFKHQDHPTESRLHFGMARGLEMALVRMGVLNDELDELTKIAYNQALMETYR